MFANRSEYNSAASVSCTLLQKVLITKSCFFNFNERNLKYNFKKIIAYFKVFRHRVGVSTLERSLSLNPGHDGIKLILMLTKWPVGFISCDNTVSFDNSRGNGMLGC